MYGPAVLLAALLGSSASAEVLPAALLLAASPALPGEVRFEGGGRPENPVWSNDGEWLAFEVNRLADDDGGVDLYLARMTGAAASEAVRVQPPGAFRARGGAGQVVSGPAWHSNGYLVFQGTDRNRTERLYVRDPAAEAATELLTTSDAPGHLRSADVSTDGPVVFERTGDLYAWERYGGVRQLTDAWAVEALPQVSDDGRSVAFTRSRTVVVLDLATGEETPCGPGIHPTWAADGELVWYRDTVGSDQLWVWDLVAGTPGGPRRVVARDVRPPGRARPAVTPDGAWVAWVSTSNGSLVQLTAMDASAELALQTSLAEVGELAFGLQGDRLLLAFTHTGGLYVTDVSELVLGGVAEAGPRSRRSASAPASGAAAAASRTHGGIHGLLMLVIAGMIGWIAARTLRRERS